MYQDLALYIDGEFIKGGDRREQDVINPATQEVLGKLPHATRADLDRALAAAQRAFETWKKTSPLERSAILRRVAELTRTARQGNRPRHHAGPGQAAGRGRGRSDDLRRARRDGTPRKRAASTAA